jgi:transposase
MTRRQKDPLRPLTSEERSWLIRISRSHAEPASHVARARALLAVAGGRSYTEAAKAAGRRSGDAVSQLVARFNREGIAAIEPRHGGGPTPIYTGKERERILQEARRAANREKDGTATWSLSMLRGALRRAPDGLPMVSTYTIWKVLKEAGFDWQRTRSWCETGRVERKRKKKSGEVVEVIDPDAEAKKLDRTRLHRGREAGFVGVVPRSSGTFSDHALSGKQLGTTGQASTPASPAFEERYGQAHELVPSGYGKGSGEGGKELRQRGAPPLAQRAVDEDPQNPAAVTGSTQSRGEPRHVEKLAGRACGTGDAAQRVATSEDVGGA